MAVSLQKSVQMRKAVVFAGVLALLFLGVSKVKAQVKPSEIKEKRIIYFNPEVFPDIEEIKPLTNNAFFSAVSDQIVHYKSNRLIRAETPIVFDSIDAQTVEEYCRNNDAEFAVVPKIKYFKVGLGKYVFSNQVVVSMKLYDSKGNFITETHYDTYKKNMRMLGSAENSIKIGTVGAMKNLLKNLRQMKFSESGVF